MITPETALNAIINHQFLFIITPQDTIESYIPSIFGSLYQLQKHRNNKNPVTSPSEDTSEWALILNLNIHLLDKIYTSQQEALNALTDRYTERITSIREKYSETLT